MKNEIDAILKSYHFATLWKMAHAADLKVTDQWGTRLRKTELVHVMRAEFFSQARVRASWKRLNQREQAIVNRLLLRGGSARTESFQREIVRAKLATQATRADAAHRYSSDAPYATSGYIGGPGRRQSFIFEDLIAQLTLQGLVFSKAEDMKFKLKFHPGDVLYVPEIVRRYLAEPEPILDTGLDWQPAHVSSGDPIPLLRNLYLYWDTVRRNEVKLIQAGYVGKRWLKIINKLLLTPDPSLQDAQREDETDQLYLLRQLLQALDLVRSSRRTLDPIGQDPLHIPEFWSRSPSEQLSACLQAWPRLDSQEVMRRDIAQYDPRDDHARSKLLQTLKTLPPGMWFEREDLLERIRERDANFLFAERTRIQNYRSRWYYSRSGSFYGSPEELLQVMDRFEIEFVDRRLGGFMHRLGAVELGYSDAKPGRADDWHAFRLTPAGLAMLDPGSTQHPLQDEKGKLIIQPNFQILAIGPVSLAALAQLDLFAERESADRGAFQYRLSRESVYGAQQCGMRVADVIRLLQESSDTPLPQNVHRSLDEWAAHHERIVFRTDVSLLQAADADLLAELMQAPRTGEHLARALTPEVALLKKNRQRQLVAALVEQELFPATSGAGQDADHSVVIHADGSIRPIHPVPSLHLYGQLSQVAEETDDGGWRITPASVRRAGGDKDKARQILDKLRNLHRGPLPDTLADQIKAWGGYYGRAAAETLTLIEFRDQATLDELRAQPELGAHLTAFRAGERALAVVSEGDLAQVKEILARLGIRVRDGLWR